jgi:hypothetical protein
MNQIIHALPQSHTKSSIGRRIYYIPHIHQPPIWNREPRKQAKQKGHYCPIAFQYVAEASNSFPLLSEPELGLRLSVVNKTYSFTLFCITVIDY